MRFQVIPEAKLSGAFAMGNPGRWVLGEEPERFTTSFMSHNNLDIITLPRLASPGPCPGDWPGVVIRMQAPSGLLPQELVGTQLKETMWNHYLAGSPPARELRRALCDVVWVAVESGWLGGQTQSLDMELGLGTCNGTSLGGKEPEL